jgi:hypothetical protein
MSDPVAQQDPFELDGVRTREDYTAALTLLVERGRRERCASVVSSTEAYAAAELLGQFAQLEPTGELNQLAASLASRIFSRLGA